VSRPRRGSRAAPAAPGLTLAVDATLDAVIATVTVPAGATYVYIFRTGPSGVGAYLRGFNPATVAPSSTAIAHDYEAAIGVPLVYTAFVADATGAQSPAVTATVTVPSQGCSDTWLTDIAAPANTQRVILERLDELAYEAASGVHHVLNRRTPIVTSDVAHTPTFELNVLTETDAEREKARAALGNGVPILLRTPPENGIGNVYFVVTDWKEQRIVNAATVQDRRFVLTCTQVDRPDPILYVPDYVASYNAIRNTYRDYAALLAARPTYDAVLHDPTSAAAAAIVPWPPDDV
jgi:hypothetical protein